MIVSVIQMDPTPRVKENIHRAFTFLLQAARAQAELVILPELFIYRGDPREYPALACSSRGAIVSFFAAIARQYAMTIVLGSVPERGARAKIYDTSFVISRNGEILSRYRKKKLFHVRCDSLCIQESDFFERGNKEATFSFPRHKIGLTICFELRYPDLFAQAREKGISAFCVPSNFTDATGKAHWHTLVRARAIETQSFLFAANCCGVDRFSGVRSYGHSMIVDPWGKVIAELKDREGIITRSVDLDDAGIVRSRIMM
jgi:deaminated glutathione amidase